jgi:hypothetical protein
MPGASASERAQLYASAKLARSLRDGVPVDFRIEVPMADIIIYMKGPDFAHVPGPEVPADNVFPLFDVYSDIVNARGGTPVPESNTRYWDKPTYPTGGTVYSSVSALNTAIASASPGDILRLQDGTYNGATITINSSGNSSSAITVAAQTKGGVTFTGNTSFVVSGDYLNLFGFNFSGSSNVGAVFDEASSSQDNVYAYHTFNDLTCTNGTNNQFYIRIAGDRSRRCYITINSKSSNRASMHSISSASYERIDHIYFNNLLGGGGSGDDELLQIAQNQADSDHYALIDNNYFYLWNNNNGSRFSTSENEMTTSKSGSNMFIRNYAFACLGNMNERESHKGTYYANIIEGNNITNAGGIQLGGNDCYAFCNYIFGINPTDSSGQRGISMRQGGTGTYEASVRNEASFNAIFDSVRSLAVGAGGSGPTQPSNCEFYNNWVDQGSKNDNAIDVYTGTGHIWGGNVLEAPLGISNPGGITVADPDNELDGGFLVPISSGNLDGTGVNGYSALCTVDLLGNPIPANDPNVGPFQSGWDLTSDPRQQIIDEAGA